MDLKNLNFVIKQEDGVTPLLNTAKEGRPQMTFRDVCANSLLAQFVTEQGKPEEDKVKMEKWELHKKIRDAKGEADLSVEELALLKKWIGYWQPQLIMGQCFDLIDPNKEIRVRKS